MQPRANSRDVVVVLGAIRMRVEVPRAVVADVLQQLHEEERALDVGRPEAEILVVAAQLLVVQVDVEQLPASSACATWCTKFRPAIVSWANSGFTPTISGCSSVGISAR